METKRFYELVEKYRNENLSEEEYALLQELVKEEWDNIPLPGGVSNVDWERIYAGLIHEEVPVIPMRRRKFFRVIAAASVILLLCAGTYFLFLNPAAKKDIALGSQQQRYKNDVAPGGNKAVLTLADGSRIILDSAHKGTITQQGNTKILKLDSSQLAYNNFGSSLGAAGEVLYNTISTPRGGEYRLILADGSKVWLNAASSLRYPTAFTKDRNVELTGEGYFEVAHNAAKHFRVTVNGISVEDLGTHFNINAYGDEATIKTTLLEGAVRILPFGKAQGKQAQDDKGVVIKPGQQAQVGGDIKVVRADLNEVMAWKEGRFYFDGADIKTIMRQLSRWYDVDVNYQGDIPDLFVARVSRELPVSKLLQLLELTNLVHFKIDGNKITVMK